MAKKTTIWGWVEEHPIIANPIIVAIYGVLMFLTLDTTDIFSPETYKKAIAIFVLALLSGLKNTIQVYQEKK